MHLIEVAANGYFNLVPWVVFLPAIGLLINLLFGGRLKEKLIGAIASLAVAASFAVAVLLTISLVKQPAGITIHFLDWITMAACRSSGPSVWTPYR